MKTTVNRIAKFAVNHPATIVTASTVIYVAAAVVAYKCAQNRENATPTED